ncbi:hypothetical protein P4324_04860 [Bacillus thuringiensis]|nr:hypothetical protein [Bacillus thuringiensis]MED2921391.1 hypothetical protein [Bacillus thuringiensis]MED3048613.1 hypothetical protein [Bacillus thuringiensis]
MSNDHPEDFTKKDSPYPVQSTKPVYGPSTPNFYSTNTFVETTTPTNTKATSMQSPDSRFPAGSAVDGVDGIALNYWGSMSSTANITVIFPTQVNLVGLKFITGNPTNMDQVFHILVEKYSTNTGTFESVNGSGSTITIPASARLFPSDYLFIQAGSYEIIRISYQNIGNFTWLPIHELLILQQ